LGAAIVGIDVSESQLAVAKRGPDTTIVYLLDTDPSIDTKYKGYFDKAALVFVLCEIPKREKVIAVLQRVHSLLKDGGTLIVLNPNWDKSNGKDFLTHQMKFTSDLHSGGAVTTILKTDPPIHIPDFYWSKQDYLAMLSEAGFSQHDIFEPLAPDDGTAWKDEKNYPPFLIIKCLKI
jgi:SAM-dependent methyltransferase